MRKLNLLILMLLAFTLGFVPASQVTTLAQDQDPGNSQMSIKDQQKKAFREKGFNAAAKITGSYVLHSGPSSFEQSMKDDPRFSLESIFGYSETAIVGYVTDNICKLYGSGDSENIVTEYKVEIVEVLKGKKNLTGQIIEVNCSGGKVMFSDGTSAEEIVSGRKMRNGGRYVLFLREFNQFSPELGKQKKLLFTLGAGVFEITPEQKIHFCGIAASPERYNDYDVDNFLQEVKSLAKKNGSN